MRHGHTRAASRGTAGAAAWPGWPRRTEDAILTAALAGIVVLAAACAGGAPAGTGSGSSQAPYRQALAYAHCMRAHGDLGFPDPNSQGLFLHPAGPGYQAATSACGHLLPSEPLTAAQKQDHVRQALRFAACMRSHGYPNYPDPIVRNGGAAVGLGFGGIDQSSPRFHLAVRDCREFEPGLVAQLAGGGTP